jgi:hypothetical protein
MCRTPAHAAFGHSPAMHRRSPVAQTFLSAGSGDFPVPRGIPETALEKTLNPQAGKPALPAADAQNIVSYLDSEGRALRAPIRQRPTAIELRNHNPNAAKVLPLLPRREERAGERRGIFARFSPLPNPLPARSSRGEGENSLSPPHLIQWERGGGEERSSLSESTRQL